MLRNWLRPSAGIRSLTQSDLADVTRLLRSQPMTSLLAAQNLQYLGPNSHMLGLELDDELVALCWAGSNIIPVGEADALPAFAQYLRRRGRRATSIVGSADLVLELWELLEHSWGPAREVRADQPCLFTRTPALVAADSRVRRTTAADAPLLLPAAVAMFSEEVGYDPTRSGEGYAHYVRGLATSGRSYVIVDQVDGQPAVIFKADVGALWDGVAQIQGVWVHPALRARGIATGAMASVVNDVLTYAEVVSLYVNSYNGPARRVYQKVGFTQEGTYATVLL